MSAFEGISKPGLTTGSFRALGNTLSIVAATIGPDYFHLLGGDKHEDQRFEARIGVVVRSAGGCRAGRHRGEAGAKAVRGRGPRHLRPSARRLAVAAQGDTRDKSWRRCDRLG